MSDKEFIVYYCEPYKYNDRGFLRRSKTFSDWGRAYDFMSKKQEETGLHCAYVELDFNSSGIFNIT